MKEDSQPDLAFFNLLVETAVQRHILPKRKEQERESEIAKDTLFEGEAGREGQEFCLDHSPPTAAPSS